MGKTSVGIIGGGLAGLAAAVALCEHAFRVEIFEARRRLGGRAGSFRDPATGRFVDHCQHVSMGCCTNLADFCRRVGIAELFRRDKVLHFMSPDGRRFDLSRSPWLPAPLHLAPSLLRLGYLTWRERLGVGGALLRLVREPAVDSDNDLTIGQWLRDRRQSQRAIDRFWSVLLVSALGETVDLASLAAARKVLVDGFLAARQAYELELPTAPLGDLFGERLTHWLSDRDVQVHLGTAAAQLQGDAAAVHRVELADGTQHEFDYVVVALPWRRVRAVFSDPVASAVPGLSAVKQIESAPITAIHLWLDRPITPLPHAVLIGRLSQWVFNGGEQVLQQDQSQKAYYYQVVISASRQLAGRQREEVVEQVRNDLNSVWPGASKAKLRHWRMVTQHDAVFSTRPSVEALRLPQQTAIRNLVLAGDWTQTGWPSTMEGAVRSGYLAAEAVLRSAGHDSQVLVPDLARGDRHFAPAGRIEVGGATESLGR